MAKRYFAIFLSIILMAGFAISMVGCGCGVEDDVAIELVKDLVYRSYELNVVYYGEGLEYEPSPNPNDIYLRAKTGQPLASKNELTKRTREVFSSTLAENMIRTAFNGISNDPSLGSVQSRYTLLGDPDWIYVNKNYEPVVEKAAVYNYDTIVITKTSGSFIEATIQTQEGRVVEVTLVLENDVWKLDSITC